MERKTGVITGATSGIGKAIAGQLAKAGFDLVLIGRNPAKGHRVVEDAKAYGKDQLVTYYNIDLCSQRQIRQVGAAIQSAHPRIDVLLNNAGIWTSRCELTDDQVEKQHAINHHP